MRCAVLTGAMVVLTAALAGAAPPGKDPKVACLDQCGTMVAGCVESCVAQAGRKELPVCQKSCEEYSKNGCSKLCENIYGKPTLPKR